MVLLEFRGGLAFRYLLPRRQRMQGPSISLVRDLLLRRSFFFGHLSSLAPDRLGRRNSLYRPRRSCRHSVLLAHHNPRRAPRPLKRTPHSDSRSLPHNWGMKPAIVDATKIAIQVRTRLKPEVHFLPSVLTPQGGGRPPDRVHSTPPTNTPIVDTVGVTEISPKRCSILRPGAEHVRPCSVLDITVSNAQSFEIQIVQ